MTVPLTRQPRVVQAVVAGPTGAGLRFSAEYMSGNVKSYKGRKPNEASITIHNLSRPTIAQIEAPNGILQIMAGEPVLGQLFIGSIAKRGIETKWNIPDRTTTITAKDGRRVFRDTTVATSYPPNTSVALVVQDLLKKATLQGLAIATGNVYPTDSFPAGWAHFGPWRQALTEILAPRGFYWEIQGRTIYVLNEASTAPGNVPLVSPQTGLIGSPKRTDKGCNIKSVLNPTIMVSRGVQVTSAFFNGLYRAVVVEHKFDSDGLMWETNAQLEVIK